jgi:hypothetical protein
MVWRKGVVGEDSSNAVNDAAANEGVMHPYKLHRRLVIKRWVT